MKLSCRWELAKKYTQFAKQCRYSWKEHFSGMLPLWIITHGTGTSIFKSDSRYSEVKALLYIIQSLLWLLYSATSISEVFNDTTFNTHVCWCSVETLCLGNKTCTKRTRKFHLGLPLQRKGYFKGKCIQSSTANLQDIWLDRKLNTKCMFGRKSLQLFRIELKSNRLYTYKRRDAFPSVGFRPTTVWPQCRHSRLFTTPLSRTSGGKEPFLCFTPNYGIKVGKYFLYSWLVLQPKRSLIMLCSDSHSLHCQRLSIIQIGKQKNERSRSLENVIRLTDSQEFDPLEKKIYFSFNIFWSDFRSKMFKGWTTRTRYAAGIHIALPSVLHLQLCFNFFIPGKIQPWNQGAPSAWPEPCLPWARGPQVSRHTQLREKGHAEFGANTLTSDSWEWGAQGHVGAMSVFIGFCIMRKEKTATLQDQAPAWYS